jgi:peptide/nickel transport system substrate-binding protein
MRRLGGLLALALIATGCGSPATTTHAPSTTAATLAPTTTTTAAADTTRPVRPSTTTTTEAPTAPTGGRVRVPVHATGNAPFSFSPWSPGFIPAIGEAYLAGAVEVDPVVLDFVPNLVSEVPTTDNGGVVVREDGTMTVTYRIRPEAVWDDGTPVSGEDFAFTYETLIGLDLDDADLSLYREILPESVAVGEQAFSYTLPRPTIEYERLFGVVLPRHAVAGTDLTQQWTVRPWPSAGPFRFEGWAESPAAPGAPGSVALFVRNDSYWQTDSAGQPLPYLDAVEFHFVEGVREEVEGFARGAFDIMELGAWPDVISRLESLVGVTVTLGDGSAWEHLAFQFGPNDRNRNTLNESATFRRAVAHALDRSALAAVGSWVNGGALSSFLDLSPIPRGEGWDRYAYDPVLAAALVEEACAELRRDCSLQSPLVVINTTAGGGLRTEAGRLAEEMLDAVGIDARLAVEDTDLFFGPTFLRGTWDVGMWAWEMPGGLSGILRTLAYWDPAGPPPLGLNYQRWGTPAVSGQGADFDQGASRVSNPDTARYAAILEEMRVTVDRDRLVALAIEAEEILAEQVVIIPLATRGKAVAWWSGAVGGVRNHPSRPTTWNVERWYRLDV